MSSGLARRLESQSNDDAGMYVAIASGRKPGGVAVAAGHHAGVCLHAADSAAAEAAEKVAGHGDAVKAGERGLTSGGLRGPVVALKEGALHPRGPPGKFRPVVAES